MDPITTAIVAAATAGLTETGKKAFSQTIKGDLKTGALSIGIYVKIKLRSLDFSPDLKKPQISRGQLTPPKKGSVQSSQLCVCGLCPLNKTAFTKKSYS